MNKEENYQEEYIEDEEDYEEDVYDDNQQQQDQEEDEGDNYNEDQDDQEELDNDNQNDNAYSNNNDNGSNGLTPGNASEGYDRVQLNNNFNFQDMKLQQQQQRNKQQNLEMISSEQRPKSAIEIQELQQKNQQQVYQNQNITSAWIQQQQRQQENQNYQGDSHNNSSGTPYNIQSQQINNGPIYNIPYTQASFFYQNKANNPVSLKRRPITANKKPNQWQMNFKQKGFVSKNPSALDLEVSKMRPRMIVQERERLYDDVMKQKITGNYIKEENIRLKTKIHILESELNKKEKLVDELIMQQDTFQVAAFQSNTKNVQRNKLDSHLSMNLKRKIREFQSQLTQKQEEIDALKRNIKNTKIDEIETEMRTYSDECLRLRLQLEEVIKSKDTFADPEELRIIEDKFQQQDILINNMKNENNELINAFNQKDGENRQLAQFLNDMEKRIQKSQLIQKETTKLKKSFKDKEKENKRLQNEITQYRQQNDELRTRFEELSKKPQTTRITNTYSSSANQNSNINLDQEVTRLRNELQNKDNKMQELTTMVSQLQGKLQNQITEIQKEQQDKNKYKSLYEQYQDEVARMQAQLEDSDQVVINQRFQPSNIDKQDNKQINCKEKNKQEVKKFPKVDIKQISDVFQELKLKLQIKGFYPNQIKDLFFKPYQQNEIVTIKNLQDLFELFGFDEKKSQLAARYLIESQLQSQLVYDENASSTQEQISQNLMEKIGQYQLYNDAKLVMKYNDIIQKSLQSCKNTLKETFQLEDYEEEGIIAIGAFLESFETLEINLDQDLMDYIIYVIYSKSESIYKLKYQTLFDLLDGKIVQGNLSVASDTQSRKRPESSSPEKLKARNKEKFNEQQNNKKQIEKTNEEDDDNYDDENYEEEFEKLLDKDDQENEDDNFDKSKNEPNNNIQQENQNQVDSNNDQDEEEEYYDQNELLDVAEKCFVTIAERLLTSNQNVRQAFQNYIITEDIEGTQLELLSPIGLLEGLKELGLTELEEIEVACLMRVLTKPNLENAILLKELIVIMENFGIYDEEGEQQQKDEDNNQEHSQIQEPQSQQNTESPQKSKTKKKKGHQSKPMDLSQLDEKSIKILAKLMLALMELNVSLYDFFEGAIYEQLVKTKTKQNVVEIIKAQDFYEIIQSRGVRKSNKEHEILNKSLQLDPNYPELLMLKKLAKALDELAKNEELMGGIFAAAQTEYGNDQPDVEETEEQRLNTRGEDDEERQNTNKSKGNNSKKQVINNNDQQEEDNYDDMDAFVQEDNDQDEF